LEENPWVNRIVIDVCAFQMRTTRNQLVGLPEQALLFNADGARTHTDQMALQDALETVLGRDLVVRRESGNLRLTSRGWDAAGQSEPGIDRDLPFLQALVELSEDETVPNTTATVMRHGRKGPA